LFSFAYTSKVDCTLRISASTSTSSRRDSLIASTSWESIYSDELREASTELSALRVALFYGDFSGLQGLGFEVIR
jgi:hypothetical protein